MKNRILPLSVLVSLIAACVPTVEEPEPVAPVVSVAAALPEVEEVPFEEVATVAEEGTTVEDEEALSALSEPLPMPEELATPISPDEPLSVTYTLRRGETLAHFARWSGLTIEDVAESSGLDLHGRYPVGTEVLLPVGDELAATIVEQREAHHRKRVEGYLASRGGAKGTNFHRVRTGETAWSIAQDADKLPVWVVESYNPTVDLEALRPGQELMLPILADTVVDASEDE